MDPVLLLREAWTQQYNCSFYEVESIPSEQRRHVVKGAICIALFVIFEALYVPCLIVIGSRTYIKQTCFKLMLLLGIADTACLWASGFFAGYFAITGTVYCSNPTLMLVVCLPAMWLWGIGSMTSVILALNRCLVMHDRRLAHRIFDGRRIYLWLALPVVYGFCGMLGARPILYNGIYMAGFFNPHEGYYPDTTGLYHNYLHTLNNFFVVIALILIYATFVVMLNRQKRQLDESARRKLSKREISSFLQILLIASLNATTCLIYIYIQFFNASQTVILIGTYTFCCVQGCPALIYVFLNSTNRKALLEKLSRGKLNFATVISSDAYAVDPRRTMSRTEGHTRNSISVS